MARIAVPATEPRFDAPSAAHVPRAPHFIIADTEGSWEVIANPGATAESHPGAHAAKALIRAEVQAVVGHHMGPHPVHALEKAGVIIYRGDDGVPVRDMVARFTSGSLVPWNNEPSHISPALNATRASDRPSAYLLEYALHVLRRFAGPGDADDSPIYARNH